MHACVCLSAFLFAFLNLIYFRLIIQIFGMSLEKRVILLQVEKGRFSGSARLFLFFIAIFSHIPLTGNALSFLSRLANHF